MSQAKHPVFKVIEASPRLLDAHAAFLVNGGEALLHAMNDTFRQELWPWDKDAQHQASFGAFCAGVAWASKVLRNLHELSRNRSQFLEMLASVGEGRLSDAEKELLKTTYGFTDDEIAKHDTP